MLICRFHERRPYCGRRFRTFNVVDGHNQEALGIDIDLNLSAPRVTRTLEHIAAWRGYLARLRLDNDPKLVSVALAEWAETHRVELDFIEQFNRTYRDEVGEITDRWLSKYNEERPHESLGDLTSIEYQQQ